MVKIAVCWCRQFEFREADIIKGLVINAERFIGILVNRKGGIVGLERYKNQQRFQLNITDLDDSIRKLGTGTTEYVHIILSGYSSRIFEIKSVPIPAPVPPPSEWVIWKPVHHSALDGIKEPR